VLSWTGLLIFVLPGLYFWIAYSFALPLVCDQGLSPWQALETSRRAATHKWFTLLGLTLLVGVLTCVSALGLLIPLIWTLPWSMMTTAVAYRRIFYGAMPGAPVAAPSLPLPPGALR